MRILDLLRNKEKPLSPEAAAARLDSYAREDLQAERLPGVDPSERPTVSLNYYLTKAAIIIQWLRILEHDAACKGRAREVLDEFEQLTFSPLPAGKRAYIVEHIRKLISLVSEINRLMENRSLSEVEIGATGFSVAERWFGTAFDDEDLVIRATVVSGAELISILHDEMRVAGQRVEEAAFGRGSLR
jgi:hypothetical protein